MIIVYLSLTYANVKWYLLGEYSILIFDLYIYILNHLTIFLKQLRTRLSILYRFGGYRGIGIVVLYFGSRSCYVPYVSGIEWTLLELAFSLSAGSYSGWYGLLMYLYNMSGTPLWR